jgi:hypothetical protein
MTQPTLWQPSDIVSAEAGGEAETPKRRGRIPQSAWPHILERHRAGATLSAIAREFDCTPSAISYIVRKAEAAGIAPSEAGAAVPESGPTAEGGAEARGGTDAPPPEIPAGPAGGPPPPQASAETTAGEAAGEAGTTPPEAAAQPSDQVEPKTGPAPIRLRRREPRGEGGLLRAPKREQGEGQPAAPRPAEPPRDAQQAQPSAAQPAASRPASAAQPPAAPQQPAAQGQTPPPAAAAGRSEPVDAVEGRLRDTARTCLLAYRGWRTQPGEQTVQTLSDALHDLRKALARIEIDMSATRRDEQAQRPIPIPAHRASRRPR